ISGDAAPIWSDVEIKRILNVSTNGAPTNATITVSINKTVVLTTTRATNYLSGDIMLGYSDPYASIGDNGAVYYSNVRVVDLSTNTSTNTVITITNIRVVGTNVIMTFTTTDSSDTGASFTLQSSAVVTGPYVDVSPAATITQVSPRVFQAITGVNGPTRFYRIRHN
ncbi:MAG: hypothetical protein ACR2H1_13325, partial [Limisphaerales bacterium]